MEKLNLVTLWSHYDISHTFEQICRNGRVSHSTVDHFVVSPRLLPLVEGCGVIHRGDNLSVHSPIWLKLQVGDLPLKKQTRTRNIKKPSWSKADKEQVYNYTSTLQEKLQAIQVPLSLNCQDVHCQSSEHSVDRDNMVVDILTAVVETFYTALPLHGSQRWK